jgi:signal transduction histidine kinase
MMTELDAAEQSLGNRVIRAGLRRFDRLFTIIVGVFGLLFALQTGDSLVADIPAMSSALGAVVIALVLLSVLTGLGPILVPTRARAISLSAIGLYTVALLLWPLSVQPPLPTDPMPWIVAIWPVPAAYAAHISTSRRLTIIGGLLLSAYAGIALQQAGRLDAADAAVNSLFMAGIVIVLVLLLGMVRRGIVAAGAAQQAALLGYATTELDEATETERKRTDALLNDAVLTTFLSAAAAATDEDDRLARRMATNALRVLLHVHGVDRQAAAMTFGQALAERRHEYEPWLPLFDVDLGPSETIMLPEDVARAIADILIHGVQNSVRHALDATGRVIRVSRLGPDGIRVQVEDDGCGFDPDTVGTEGRGHASLQRLRTLEARADVRAAPGRGVTLTVSWGSVVMVGTTPLPDEAAPLLAGENVGLA